MLKKLNIFKTNQGRTSFFLTGSVMVVAVAGSVAINMSRAATPFVSLQPESGTRSGTTALVQDATASAGSAVKFVPPTSTGTSTGGSGGAMSDLSNQSYAAPNGRSSTYAVWASGLSSTAPIGLVVGFHGDGMKTSPIPIQTSVKGHRMLYVSIATPDSGGDWWSYTLSKAQANAAYAHSLILNKVYAKYNIDLGNVWLAGYSGGSWFITEMMFPSYSDMFQGGGLIMMAGGGVPMTGVTVTPPWTQPLKNNTFMKYYTGLNDESGTTASSSARGSKSYYAGQGFTTNIEQPSNITHSNINYNAVVDAVLTAHP